jgi:hypothetical protein
LSSTTQASVPADAREATSGGRAASTSSIRLANDQVCGSSSITSSSIPTVHTGTATLAFQRIQSGINVRVGRVRIGRAREARRGDGIDGVQPLRE